MGFINQMKCKFTEIIMENTGIRMAITKLLTQEEVADVLGISPGTLAQWRCEGKSILKYIKIGGAVRYKESDLHEYISIRTFTPQATRLSVSIPSAFSELPDKTLITKKELCKMIGKGIRTIPTLILDGSIPQPINIKPDGSSRFETRLVWSLGSIRKLKAESQSNEM